MNPPLVIVVMGVSGCGKSTAGKALARALCLPYLEGDDFHPPANVAKMAAGVPLIDADRADWLAGLAHEISAACTADTGSRGGVVLSCSALKRRYRDVLRKAAPGLRFIYLHGERSVLHARLSQRTDHYMPATLLDSQLADLEIPDAEEQALQVDIALAPEAIVAAVQAWLGPV